MASYTVPEAAACGVQIDERYEFRAPKFFDFINEETEADVRAAELWFETALSHAPSPFAPRIRESRTVEIGSLCDFGDAARTQKEEELAGSVELAESAQGNAQESDAAVQEKDGVKRSVEFLPKESKPSGNCEYVANPQREKSAPSSSGSMSDLPPKEEETLPSFEFPVPKDKSEKSGGSVTPNIQRPPTKVKAEACTPKAQINQSKGGATAIGAKSRQPSSLKPKPKSPVAQSSKSIKKSVIKCPHDLVNGKTADIVQENQAVKRQKLDDGRTRQILNVKSRVLPHKDRGDLARNTEVGFASMKKHQEDAHCLKEGAIPFVSAAEMVKRFESRTRELEIPHKGSLSHEDSATALQRRTKLVLTRPKEPQLQTAQRVRAVRMKSSAELEEEMLAKIPKFRARPFNKKMAETCSLPPIPRSTPQLPEFNEFHLKTMERALRHADACSEVSSIGTYQSHGSKPLKLTEPKPPQLETTLRARPPRVKSSQEMELEELEKAPKFRARPLNRKILDSKGDIGVFRHTKPQVTTPEEFHFATNDRLGAPPAVMELFDKLSLHSESSSHNDRQDVPRITIPNPFNLHTEERGIEKERQLAAQLLQQQLEEEKARIPKANPYPYSTDFPVVPPKPEPRSCTRPESFQLESLVRHEEEMQKRMEERERMEREEAQRRIFRAQPVLKEDPIPLPERERKPLTEVQQFVLHVDHRSVQRSEFDNKIKEKEMTYKRLREENEFAQQIEEEKALKQLRRTMVPHARPVPAFHNPFCPQRSTKQITMPKSPHLRVDHRAGRRHAFMR